MTTSTVIPVLQTAIGPMILISGAGLLILTMTNRMARTIDRARALGAREREGQERVEGQLSILWTRAKILRLSLLCAAISSLCAAVLITVLFLAALMGISLGSLIAVLFIASMLSLCLSLVLFIKDVNMALEALKVELARERRR